MSYWRCINPVEVAFYEWINLGEDFYHPLDDSRFFAFVDAVRHYEKTEGKKWFSKEYFKNRCSECDNPRLTSEIIKSFWQKFELICEYFRLRNDRKIATPKMYRPDDEPFVYKVSMVIDGKLHTIYVPKELYDRKHISKKLFVSLLNEKGTN